MTRENKKKVAPTDRAIYPKSRRRPTLRLHSGAMGVDGRDV